MNKLHGQPSSQPFSLAPARCLLCELGYPSVGRLDTKVSTGCTVTAQRRHRVEASCQLPAGVQSRLMGSKKALRKRGNFRNSKNHKLIEPYGELLDSRQNCTGFHANGISR